MLNANVQRLIIKTQQGYYSAVFIPNKQIHVQSQQQKFQKKMHNSFKVNNEDIKMTSLTHVYQGSLQAITIKLTIDMKNKT